jgi:2-oxoglutarate dehydrogenase E1 component
VVTTSARPDGKLPFQAQQLSAGPLVAAEPPAHAPAAPAPPAPPKAAPAAKPAPEPARSAALNAPGKPSAESMAALAAELNRSLKKKGKAA